MTEREPWNVGTELLRPARRAGEAALRLSRDRPELDGPLLPGSSTSTRSGLPLPAATMGALGEASGVFDQAAAAFVRERAELEADARDGATPAHKSVRRVWERAVAAAREKTGRNISAALANQPPGTATALGNAASKAEQRYLSLAFAGADSDSVELALGLFRGAVVTWLNFVSFDLEPAAAAPAQVVESAIWDLTLLRHGRSEFTARPSDVKVLTIGAADRQAITGSPAVQALAHALHRRERAPRRVVAPAGPHRGARQERSRRRRRSRPRP